MTKYLFFAIIAFLHCAVQAQSVESPNFGRKTHKTLDIEKIELQKARTLIFLKIENRVQGGSFCADRNIFIENTLTGKRFALLRSENIPTCPQTHKFSRPYEVLRFRLVFPALPKGTKYINLVENCQNACFSFHGIILDQQFNQQIDRAFAYYAQNKTLLATETLKESIESHPDYLYGFLYAALIKMYSETGDKQQARQWQKKLRLSAIKDKNELLSP